MRIRPFRRWIGSIPCCRYRRDAEKHVFEYERNATLALYSGVERVQWRGRDVPIVPMVVSALKPETDLRGRQLTPHDVVLRMLEPVYPTGSFREDEDALRAEVRVRMEAALRERCTDDRGT